MDILYMRLLLKHKYRSINILQTLHNISTCKNILYSDLSDLTVDRIQPGLFRITS